MAITEYSMLKAIASIGQQLISSIISLEDVSSVISHISKQLYSICSEIRDAYLEGASDSIDNARKTNSSALKADEINKAIIHLENAYYLSKKLIDKKSIREYTYLLFFTGREEIDAVPWRYRKIWQQGQIEICTTLALLYRYKKADDLELKWSDEANRLYQEFAKQFLTLSEYDLEKIDSDFVYHTTRVEYERVEYNEFLTKFEKNEIEETHITVKGAKYQENHLQNLISEFSVGLKSAKLL